MSLGTTLALLGVAGVGAFAAYKFGLFGKIASGAGAAWDGVKNIWSAVGGWKFALGTAAALFVGKKLGGTKGLLIAGALAAALGGFMWWKNHKKQQELEKQQQQNQFATADATPGVPGSELSGSDSLKGPNTTTTTTTSGSSDSVVKIDGPDQPSIAGARPLTRVDGPVDLSSARPLGRTDTIPAGDRADLKAMTDGKGPQTVKGPQSVGAPRTLGNDDTRVDSTRVADVTPAAARRVGLTDQIAASTDSKAPKAPAKAPGRVDDTRVDAPRVDTTRASRGYDIVPGDTLSQLAASNGLTTDQLLQARGPSGETNAELLAKSGRGDFNPDRIYPGQRIYLPQGQTSSKAPAKAPLSIADGGR